MAKHKIKKTKKSDTVEFLSTARKRYSELYDKDAHNKDNMRDSLRFVYDIDQGQWSEADRKAREDEGKPCLTSNKLRKFVASVANAERDQRPANNVIAVDDKGDELTAEIYSGLIRQIGHASNVSEVYTLGGEQAIAGGEGFWRIEARELPDSFEQELFIVAIKNQFSVYLDPDGMFGFIGKRLTKDEFEFQYPDATPEDADGDADDYSHWYEDESVYIREYFYKERTKVMIVQASKIDPSGQLPPVENKIFELPNDISEEEFEAQGWVIDKREDGSEIKKSPFIFNVKWAKITASQILEEGEWAGKDIPIIQVQGDWVWLEGKCYKKGVVDGAKDDQRMYNYWKTSITERYALSIKAPYLVTAKMIAGFESIWRTANRVLLPFLTFNHDKNAPGGPRREPAPQISTGETQMLSITGSDIEDTIGRFQSSFGAQSNERSAVAIDARASRSERTTFHFPDNFIRAINQTTRQLIDLIPHHYDTQRVQRIMGENGDTQLVVLNHSIMDESNGHKHVLNDLSVGKYDLVENVKLMSTRREEMLNGMKAMVAGNPQLQIVLAPFIAKVMDWDGHQEIAATIKELTPLMLGIQPQGEEAPPEA